MTIQTTGETDRRGRHVGWLRAGASGGGRVRRASRRRASDRGRRPTCGAINGQLSFRVRGRAMSTTMRTITSRPLELAAYAPYGAVVWRTRPTASARSATTARRNAWDALRQLESPSRRERPLHGLSVSLWRRTRAPSFRSAGSSDTLLDADVRGRCRAARYPRVWCALRRGAQISPRSRPSWSMGAPQGHHVRAWHVASPDGRARCRCRFRERALRRRHRARLRRESPTTYRLRSCRSHAEAHAVVGCANPQHRRAPAMIGVICA